MVTAGKTVCGRAAVFPACARSVSPAAGLRRNTNAPPPAAAGAVHTKHISKITHNLDTCNFFHWHDQTDSDVDLVIACLLLQ